MLFCPSLASTILVWRVCVSENNKRLSKDERFEIIKFNLCIWSEVDARRIELVIFQIPTVTMACHLDAAFRPDSECGKLF